MFRVLVCLLAGTGLVLIGLGTLVSASTCQDNGCWAFTGACPTLPPPNQRLCTDNPPDPCPGAPANCACRQTARGCKCCDKS